MDDQINHIIETYKTLSSVPAPISATILLETEDSPLCIHSTWSTHDLIKAEQTKFSRDFIVERTSEKCNLLFCGIPQDITTDSLSAFAESSKRQAVLRKSSNDRVFLEIWNSSRKEKTFDLSERKEHGKIYDNMFGCLSWSADEKYLLYIAEKKQKKSVSYFKDCFCQDIGGSDKDDKDTVKGEEYLYREDWGEDLTGLHDSVICVLELETGKIEVIELSGKHENLWVTQ
ncbi:Acylamino-acid-releasing enzyme, partial [Stegodyphus mimosarum]